MATPSDERYDTMNFCKCGRSGLKLPEVSLGLWHNYGGTATLDTAKQMLLRAFDLGITHFDIANNYGPPPGSAETIFGTVLRSDLGPYRDELVISTKAGYDMWSGPYQNGGSRKYLLSSLDASLLRLGLDYVDIFYHHRPDPETPLEESMGALDSAVRQGKALYAGISNYNDPALAARAIKILSDLGTPLLIHQPKMNMFFRTVAENGLLEVLEEHGVGCITFSPLAQGLLTNRYLNGVPEDSRASGASPSALQKQATDAALMETVRKLAAIAERRGQTMAQLALAWNLSHPQVTSVLIGASKVEQIEDAVGASAAGPLTEAELSEIGTILPEM
jgi:L-glyceraldehyde 3-phosphate reductase